MRVNTNSPRVNWPVKSDSNLCVYIPICLIHFAIINILPFYPIYGRRNFYLRYPSIIISFTFALHYNCCPVFWWVTGYLNPFLWSIMYWYPSLTTLKTVQFVINTDVISWTWILNFTTYIHSIGLMKLFIFIRHLHYILDNILISHLQLGLWILFIFLFICTPSIRGVSFLFVCAVLRTFVCINGIIHDFEKLYLELVHLLHNILHLLDVLVGASWRREKEQAYQDGEK